MKVVIMESLGISEEELEERKKPLEEKGCEFVSYPKTTDIETLKEEAKDADAMIIANMPMPGEVISACEHLKFLDVAFTGVDHVGLDACREKKVAVSNASGYATQAVAELCISFMIHLLRNVEKTEKSCRSGGTKAGLIGNLLCGKTVGIVGAGAIGKKTAALCKAFGCTVIAYNRSKVSDPSIDRQVSLEELLAESDIVSLHVPLTDATKGLIGKEQLAQMKKTAFLINTARGGVADQDALAEALREGQIAGAALDVFDKEPPLPEDHPLLHTPNTIVTPHIGFASEESLEQRADIVFENLYSWLDGKQINGV